MTKCRHFDKNHKKSLNYVIIITLYVISLTFYVKIVMYQSIKKINFTVYKPLHVVTVVIPINYA